jgi:hypothetical protein
MQDEINALNPPIPVRILGVNKVGYEEKNEEMCRDRDLAWLQDTEEANVWGVWGAERWDIFVLDTESRLIDIYDVGAGHNPLNDPLNYDELKRHLLELAGE